MPRVTQKNLAAHLGVHVATVSRALRNDPEISPSVRQKVQRAATKLGYVPDPFLSSLAEYRRNRHTVPTYRGNLVWLDNTATPDEGETGQPYYRSFFAGAQAFAYEHGFNLEPFYLSEGGMTAARALKILQTRAIKGIVVAPLPNDHSVLQFDWSGFANVAIGTSLTEPQLHRVGMDKYKDTLECIRHLVARGYRRIGLAVSEANTSRARYGQLAALHHYQHYIPAAEIVPGLVINQADIKKDGQAASIVAEWVRRERVEVMMFTLSRPIIEAAMRQLTDPPDLVSLSQSLWPELTGMRLNYELTGALAVQLVIGLMQTQQTGVPVVPTTTYVTGEWIDRGTIRPECTSPPELVRRFI